MRQLINTTLHKLEPEIKYSLHAENLIYGTGLQESDNWKYRKQIKGPALGLFQCEPETYKDIISNYLKYRPQLLKKIMEISHINRLNITDLISNDVFAICFCRVHYLRVSEALPTTPEGYAVYWKKYYNTYKGRGTEKQFLERYKKFN